VTLTHALARTDDEPLLDALAAALAGVSGALSCGRQVREWSHLSVAGGTPRVATPSQPLGEPGVNCALPQLNPVFLSIALSALCVPNCRGTVQGS
jgi:hypothetical protein